MECSARRERRVLTEFVGTTPTVFFFPAFTLNVRVTNAAIRNGEPVGSIDVINVYGARRDEQEWTDAPRIDQRRERGVPALGLKFE